MRNQDSLIRPGDRVKVWRELGVEEIWWSESTGNCGIVSPDGYKYGFTNWNIEKIIKEEVMAEFKEEKITSYSQLKRGDKLRITREVEVSSSDMWDGIKTKDSRKYRIAAAERGVPGFEVVRLTRLEPENWPPKLGDVWDANGTEYYIVRNSYSTTVLVASPNDTYNGSPVTVDYLKRQNPALKYRSKATTKPATKGY